jgi:hypothetical protein
VRFKNRVVVVGSPLKGIGKFVERCSLCNRKIYLLDKYKNADFICTDCLTKVFSGREKIIIPMKSVKLFNKVFKTNMTRKKLEKWFREQLRPSIAG